MRSPNTLQQELELIREQGEQFPERTLSLLPDLTFNHPRKGAVDITIDRMALSEQGQVYTDDLALRTEISKYGVHTADLAVANQLLHRSLESDSMVWGFSGYATAGYGYEIEAQGISHVYEYLAEKKIRPGLSVDGAVSAGSLGLNGIIATQFGIPTAGFIPKQGLGSIGVRDHLIIWGDEYQDRELLVGTVPDVLVCVGGSDGSLRECQTALRCGSVAILLALKDYGANSLPTTYQNFEDMNEAQRAGNLVVCQSMNDIPRAIDQMLDSDVQGGRAERLAIIDQILQ